MAGSAYVHIPFCDNICFYCDFCRVISKEKEKWLETIKKEIQEKKMGRLRTLYFGGGTPSSLEEDHFKELSSLFSFQEEYEWTVECNPDSLTESKIQLYSRLGVNRISLGVQTFKEDLLTSIGRKHTNKQVFDRIQQLKENKISNISIDLIYALPNQSMEDLKKDLDTFLTLNLPHLSIYSLQIEENSIFGKRGLEPVDEDLEADMYEYICERLKKAGYEHYEISSFCKPDKYSRHNLIYWSDEDFYGLGMGASGKENNVRYDNTRSLKMYLDQGASPVYIETTLEEKAYEAIMMGLRSTLGFDIRKWENRYKKSFKESYKDVLEKYVPEYLVLEKNTCKPTQKGMEMLNSILVDFLE
ncbi:MAG: radical SAM family heme chaperone HemW [Firmicutes bacterium]|nr:radical SAM family heme chaperone HemW [Bacillota bacterium]